MRIKNAKSAEFPMSVLSGYPNQCRCREQIHSHRGAANARLAFHRSWLRLLLKAGDLVGFIQQYNPKASRLFDRNRYGCNRHEVAKDVQIKHVVGWVRGGWSHSPCAHGGALLSIVSKGARGSNAGHRKGREDLRLRDVALPGSVVLTFQIATT